VHGARGEHGERLVEVMDARLMHLLPAGHVVPDIGGDGTEDGESEHGLEGALGTMEI
jgi:hypothetical protein